MRIEPLENSVRVELLRVKRRQTLRRDTHQARRHDNHTRRDQRQHQPHGNQGS